MRARALIVANVVLGVLVACGSDDPKVDGTNGADAGSSGFVPTGDGGGADGSSSPCGDTTSDPANCGKCGNVCPDGRTCVQGACACPAYTADCGGTCTPISGDPANCGGCGKTCTAPQVCAGTGCADSCLPGTSECSGACVDTSSDNDHCGTCGTKCPSGQGRVAGTCRAVTARKPGPNNCVGGGPPQKIGAGAQTDPCAGALATKTFTWALCSCTNIQLSGVALIDGFDSSKGTYTPGQLGAGMGYNGSLQTSSSFDIYGTMWGSAASGFQTNAPSNVHLDLRSGGNVKTASFTLDADAYVKGNVEGTPFTVGKRLFVSGTTSGVTASQVITGPVDVPPPCACEAKDILPISAIVAARATNNDNATIGLDAGVLDKPATHTRLDLPCGAYYLSTIDNGNGVTIVAHGKTALYIGGDIKNSAPLTILPDPTAELDIVVGGTISSGAALKLGSANYPALTRVYVGGNAELLFTSSAAVGANIYAPNATVNWGATTHIYGSVFAGSFKSNSALNIHYDRAVVGTASTCPPPGGGGGGGGGGAGCGSCRDCNNQACINGKCSSCTDSSQCCAPLVCINGTCASPVN